MIDHVLLTVGLADVRLADAVDVETPVAAEPVAEQLPAKGNKKAKSAEKPKKGAAKHRIFDFDTDMPLLMQALGEAEEMIAQAKAGKSKVRSDQM